MNINWIKRNRTKALIICYILFLFIIILMADKLTLLLTKNINPYIRRYITLREHYPLTDLYIEPNDFYIDSLIKKKYRIRIDANGFIIPSVKYENPDINIVFLGGSSTECLYVDERKRFPYLFGCLVEERTNLKVNSYNAAKSGNNTLHLIDILINKLIPIKPDIVFMMENINDLGILMYEKTYWNKNPLRTPIVEVKPSFSTIIKDAVKLTIPNLGMLFAQFITRDEWQHIRKKNIIIDKLHILSEFEFNLRTFVAISKVRNIVPVLMTQANRLTENPDQCVIPLINTLEKYGITYKEYRETYNSLNQKIREVATKENIPLIDLAIIVPQNNNYMYDIVHFNENGCIFVSKIIWDNLKLSHLMKKPDDR